MNIIIIGGTRGIGKELVLCLAQDSNNQILVCGRNKISLNNLSRQHKNVHTIPIDLSVFDTQADSFRETVSYHFKRVDILINMAGQLIKKEFLNFGTIEARQIMETNFFGPAAIIRIIKPFMPKGSHIVNISSMGGFQGSSKFSGLSYYSASKAALTCLSECLATEFMESGISVNCLALGAVQTEMFDEAFPGYSAPVGAKDMAKYISDFAINGHKFFNGKVIPVAINNP
jgi:short-subunit dehydrogenase